MLAGCGREIAIIDLSATFGTEAEDHRLASVFVWIFLLNFNDVLRVHKNRKWTFESL